MVSNTTHKGSCLCGGVTFEIIGDLRPVVACHCGQCRKTSGHFWAATQVNDEDLRLTHDETLEWYQSSETAERGFCRRCGSSLFWRMEGEGRTSIGAGTLDATGLSISKHIYTSHKGDYYEITDGVPQL